MAAYLNELSKKPALDKRWLLLILVTLFLPHWVNSFYYIETSVAPDLLLRTIGSRLQEAGKPIYQYKWQPGDPMEWLNPYADSRVGLNGVVSPPFLLWLLQPLARLDYCTIRSAWGIGQEILLFATALTCCITFNKRLPQIVFIIVASIFFIYDRNWILHIYNGQLYVFYAFVFSVVGYMYRKKKNAKTIIGSLLLLSIIRPFFITAIIPFFRLQKSYFLVSFLTLNIALLLVAGTTSVSEWKQYNHAMKMYAKERTGDLITEPVPSTLLTYADKCTIHPAPTFTGFGAGCLFSLQHYLFLLNIKINNTQVFQMFLLCSLLFIWFFAYKKAWLMNTEKQLLLSFLFYQLSELITPASRNPYNMIQWLPVIAWLIASGHRPLLWLIIFGLAFNHDIPFRMEYQREIGEAFLFAALATALLYKKENIDEDQKNLTTSTVQF